MEETHLKVKSKDFSSFDYTTRFTDIRHLNRNEAEIKRLNKENEFLNNILKNLFPEKAPKLQKEAVRTTIKPIYEETNIFKEPIVLSFKNKNISSKFIIKELPSTSNNVKTVSNMKNQNTKNESYNVFDKFSSLSEIKDILLNDPTYFTRMQGLKNLRGSSDIIAK